MNNYYNRVNKSLERKLNNYCNNCLNENCLLEMANAIGEDIVTDDVNFSFYFSDKSKCNHGIRVKIKWNPSTTSGSLDGYMKLHGDYEYVASPKASKAKGKDIKEAREFFKKYKVFFAAVWEGILDENNLQKYFDGRLNWNQLISKFKIEDEDAYYGINHCKDLQSLEKFIKENKIFNMND